MTPPSLTDGEGWPFRLLARVPYRPDDFGDWRKRNLAFCNAHFFPLAHAGATVPQHIGAVPIGDELPAKS